MVRAGLNAMSSLKVLSSGRGPVLVLLHGWGMNSAVWENVLESLEQFFTVIRIDLPGHGVNAGYLPGEDLTQWLDALAEAVPENTGLLGWSLGGMLALALAHRYPQKVRRLLMLCSSPKFVQSDDWVYATGRAVFDDFEMRLQTDALQALKHFLALQAAGSGGPGAIVRQLRHALESGGQPSLAGMEQGLGFLKTLDLRSALDGFCGPLMMVLGEHDPLVPAGIAGLLLERKPALPVKLISGCGHVPFISEPGLCADIIIDWFAD